MKKHFYIASMLAIFASATFADDYYFPTMESRKGVYYSNIEWVQPDLVTPYGTEPDSNDTIVVDDRVTYETVYLDKDVSVDKILWTSKGNDGGGKNVAVSQYNIKDNYSLQVGSIEVNTGVKSGCYFSYTKFHLSVANDITTLVQPTLENPNPNSVTSGYFRLGYNSEASRLKSLYVGGNIITTVGYDNKGTWITASKDRTDTFKGSFADADTVVEGFISGVDKGTTPIVNLGNYQADGDIFVKVGGLLGTTTLKSKGTSTGVTNIKFTNDGTRTVNDGVDGHSPEGGLKDAVFSGIILEEEGAAKIKFYMNSTSGTTQSFTGTSLGFSGGVVMQTGTFLVNYQDESAISHGTLSFDGASTSSNTFGNSSEDYGTFVFDSLTFAGDGTIKIQSGRQEGEFVAGTNYDLVQVTSGVSGAGSLKLDFANVADFVTEAESSLFKVISWSELGENFSEDNYKDIKVDGSNYSGYDFKYDFKEDGLYVGYVAAAVPEPSTYAAIFGALALGLAIYRRRK